MTKIAFSSDANACPITLDAPELYRVPGWNPRPSMAVPSSVRSVDVENGLVLLLTGHSLEIWSNHEARPLSRRRSVR